MGVIIREIRPSDCGELALIDAQIFSQPLSEHGFLREISNKNSYTLVADLDGQVVGYCNLWRICDEVTLNNIAVSQRFQNAGIGKALLENALDRFVDCDFITLEVRKSNVIAIKLYENFGFGFVGERKNFYENPVENALLMTKYFT